VLLLVLLVVVLLSFAAGSGWQLLREHRNQLNSPCGPIVLIGSRLVCCLLLLLLLGVVDSRLCCVSSSTANAAVVTRTPGRLGSRHVC
jgi:hypothetical protein